MLFRSRIQAYEPRAVGHVDHVVPIPEVVLPALRVLDGLDPEPPHRRAVVPDPPLVARVPPHRDAVVFDQLVPPVEGERTVPLADVYPIFPRGCRPSRSPPVRRRRYPRAEGAPPVRRDTGASCCD